MSDSSTLTHLAGPLISYGSHQRQRCSWCGYVMVDDDLTRIAVQLPEDGSPPQPPGGFPFESFVTITESDGFRVSQVVDESELVRLDDGSIKVPEDCCMRLPAELTGREE